MSSGKSLPWMPFFVGDYIAETRILDLAERGAYMDLLSHSWLIGTLPKDPVRLARLLGCSPEEFARVWPGIRGRFVETDAGFVSPRLQEQRAHSEERSDKARASAEARWSRVRKANASANALPAQSGRTSDAHAPTMLPDPDPDPNPYPPPADKREARASARPTPARRATRIPEDFDLTAERRRVAVAERVDPARTFAKFQDYWRGVSGAKGRKLDWDATWRNWCRSEADHSRTSAPGARSAGPTAVEADREALQKLMARRGATRGLSGFRDPHPGETAEHYRQAQDAEYARLEREHVERTKPVEPAQTRRPVGSLVSTLAAAKRAP